ncbi:MAG: hypothetical protein IT442_02295 [Phycisphaeraceae bacterium]|nr:hypothetical protein [Phycisphaeraceae bacterium]
MAITVGQGSHRYEWIEDWARIPDTESGRKSGRTHGVAVARDGNVVVFHQADPAVLIFSPQGKLLSAWGDRFLTAHGLTLVQDGGQDYLWLTDESTAAVVKTTLDGRVVMELSTPPVDVYQATSGRGNRYIPTWVAVDEERYGGNGDVWVADGYGASYVHRFDNAGRHLSSINGEEGEAGRFKCPHGIFIDRRRMTLGGTGSGDAHWGMAPRPAAGSGSPQAELYIADRGNKRVQVYGLDGRYRRVFGADFLTSPCCFAGLGEHLYVPELRARLTILDGDDHPVATIAANEAVCDKPGWPNERGRIEPGKLNSPHGIAVDRQGNIYIVEWIVGGRITKLERL